MHKIIVGFCFIIFTLNSYSQTSKDKQKAYQLGREAVNLMDNGEIDKSIGLLEEAYKLDPQNTVYPYEIGYAYYMKENYKKSAKYFKKVVKMKDSNDLCYQMLGNAIDLRGNHEKAIKTYKKGLEKFPNSGRLYLELGNMHLKDANKALKYYEEGIKVDPTHSSNYYWATRIYLNSTEEMWGMLYGEIFMNLERGSLRTEEISKMLFDTYQSEIRFLSDSNATVSFCQNLIVKLNSDNKALPFSMVYEPTMLIALVNQDTISLKTLNQIRRNFIEHYYNNEFNKTYPNIIFDWHQKLILEDFFECYNYWLLMKGAQDEFNSWHITNQEKFEKFIGWFTDNPMKIDKENNFHRLNY
jgi:tetratricopeptide (TPR) repeat protein